MTKRFAKEIAEEFKQKVVTKAYRGALEKEKLDVLNVVNVEEGTIEPGTPAAITVTVDVRPEFTLPDYVGLPTQIAPVDPTDAEIDGIIQALRSEGADFKAAERPAMKGDYVKLAYEGSVDGKPIAEIAGDKQLYAKVPQTWEEVEGANEGIIPGLGKQIAGVAKGDKRTVAITFPADFQPVPALAARRPSTRSRSRRSASAILPELDAAFFKAHQVDDLEGLKSQVRTNLKLQKEQQNRAAQRSQVTQALADRVSFEPPAEPGRAPRRRACCASSSRRTCAAASPPSSSRRTRRSSSRARKKAAASRVKVRAHPRQDRRGREDRGHRARHRPLHPPRGRALEPAGPDKLAKDLGKGPRGPALGAAGDYIRQVG